MGDRLKEMKERSIKRKQLLAQVVSYYVSLTEVKSEVTTHGFVV